MHSLPSLGTTGADKLLACVSVHTRGRDREGGRAGERIEEKERRRLKRREIKQGAVTMERATGN